MKRLKYNILSLLALAGLAVPTLVACSDEPDSDNYYTFTGEMMSDYLTSRPQYSEFAEIVDRAGLMDLLATWGHYTCFAPDNDAVEAYLADRGLKSIDELTNADCDTIARTHLVNNIYSTIEMSLDMLPTPNMNHRYIQTEYGLDNDSNGVVVLNRKAQIYFELQDDSVENGIVQPINMVLENTNSGISDVMQQNPRIGLFNQALIATGLRDSILGIKDDSYDNEKYARYRYRSDFWYEVATVPDTKNFGYTLFIVPDSILNVKYGITSLEQLYQKACEIYDATYPEDASQPYHAFDQLTDRRNPLNRFIAYHILTRKVTGVNQLTPLVMQNNPYQGAIGIKTDKMNPNDWYETMLPHTMMKFEQLTMREYVGSGTLNQWYINRRYDKEYKIEGSMIHATVENQYEQDSPNGFYFYIDDIAAFSTDTRDKVLNTRIRMDFSTVFPEIMTNGLRLNGDPTTDDNSASPDETFKNGRNYYFPQGYLKDVTLGGNCYFVYRRPHWNFWSYEGDEFNLFGDYDFSFRVPSVAYSGEWQLRLGFCALPTRGVAQIYFDGKPQGIPVDMRKFLNDESIMGSSFDEKVYTNMDDDEKAEDQKALKNKGYYRGAYGGYHTDGSAINEFVDNPRTYRRVLYQGYIDATKDHYIRIRCTSSSKLGNNNEFMIDYFEMVPKSVYGVTGDGQMEDDL